ncbi:MAG: RnfABCDGE type electron transport complex subunit D [Lachnospiraceae bacterium]
MEQTMKISSSPHIRDKETTTNIMGDVIIALMPAAIFGVYNFGIKALITILITVISCVVFEAGYQKLLGLKVTVKDLSAALTGLLLALNLPPEVPFWLPVIGSFFAIIVVKQLFGGLGQNFMNPALGARCFLLISFTGRMTSFTYDAVTTATPLASLKAGESVDVMSMFLGTTAGTIGETSAIALIFGGIFLLVRRIINYRIPVFYIGSFAVFIMVYALASGRGFDVSFLLAHLFGGGLMLGAFFMATDYVTSPITPNGKIIFGILLGLLTFLFRIYGGSAEGVSYAIIIGNLLVPLIERVTVPKSFGKGAVKHE